METEYVWFALGWMAFIAVIVVVVVVAMVVLLKSRRPNKVEPLARPVAEDSTAKSDSTANDTRF